MDDSQLPIELLYFDNVGQSFMQGHKNPALMVILPRQHCLVD